MKTLEQTYNTLLTQIKHNQTLSSHQQPVTCLAASKTQPPETIRALYHLGQHHFGENYLQEALTKIQDLEDCPAIQWHFIGPIQSNKTRQIAQNFQWVHSIDRFKIAKRLSEHRSNNDQLLNICIQINVSNEPSKSGITIEEANTLVPKIAQLPNLSLRGLMAIPEPQTNLNQQRIPYTALKQLLEQLNTQNQLNMDTLSMGMSQDFAIAIQEGATIVRIGSSLFGQRNKTI